ncbi:uncharacterized protein LOC115896144 [Rhinopithecus roxellana]|uniref:uncharacterized protein LOC115896144 n=1 Tax=Rhinopithecus roxellana TaxID=61622 RepID=UPI0012379034|nr:uncharacterized protein LOC115896144 [Rhinopithecus roxellana]
MKRQQSTAGLGEPEATGTSGCVLLSAGHRLGDCTGPGGTSLTLPSGCQGHPQPQTRLTPRPTSPLPTSPSYQLSTSCCWLHPAPFGKPAAPLLPVSSLLTLPASFGMWAPPLPPISLCTALPPVPEQWRPALFIYSLSQRTLPFALTNRSGGRHGKPRPAPYVGLSGVPRQPRADHTPCGARQGLCTLRLLSGGHAHHRAWRWNSNRACERALQYQLGDKIHGFTVNQVTSVPELFLTAVKLSHDDTGARYLHLAREDMNNLFRYMVHCKNMVLNVLFKSGMSNLLQRCKEMQ